MYVIYDGISNKNNLLAFMDLKYPVYVVFYDEVSDNKNLSPLIALICPIYAIFVKEYPTNHDTMDSLRHPDIFVHAYAVWTLPGLVDLICPVYVTF